MPSDKPVIKTKKITCGFCRKDEVEITVKTEYFTFDRIFGDISKTKFKRHPKEIIVNSDCPSCGATKQDIDKMLEKVFTDL